MPITIMAAPYRPNIFCQATKYAAPNIIKNGMRAGKPVSPRTLSIASAPKWLREIRVAEKAIDLIKPSRFQNRKGMDANRGTLMIHKPARMVFVTERVCWYSQIR